MSGDNLAFLRKVLVYVVGLLLIAFLAMQFGFVRLGSEGIKAIDEKYGVSNLSVYPENNKLKDYEKEIEQVITFNEPERKEKELKLEIVRFRNYFIGYLENRSRVDFQNPVCGTESEGAVKMKSDFKKSFEITESLLPEMESFEKESLGNTSKQALLEILKSTSETMKKSKNVIEKIC